MQKHGGREGTGPGVQYGCKDEIGRDRERSIAERGLSGSDLTVRKHRATTQPVAPCCVTLGWPV